MKRNHAELPSHREDSEKKARAIVCAAVALGTYFAGLLSAAAQPAPAGQAACYFVGRGYLNPDDGTSITYSYMTLISGTAVQRPALREHGILHWPLRRAPVDAIADQRRCRDHPVRA